MQKLLISNKLVIINALIAFIIVLIYNYFIPTLYSAKALIKVGTPTHSNMIVNTEVELLKSSFLISKALKDIDLSHFYYKNINYKSYPIDDNIPFRVLITRGYNILFSLKHHDSRSYRLRATGTDGDKRWSYDEVHLYGKKINNQYFNLIISRIDGVLFDGFDYSFKIYSKNSLIKRIKESLYINRLNHSSIIEINYKDTLPSRAKGLVVALARASVLESKQGDIKERKPLLLATLKLKKMVKQFDTNETNNSIDLISKPKISNTIIDIPYDVDIEGKNYILYFIFIVLFTLFNSIIILFIGNRRVKKQSFTEIKDSLDCVILGSIPQISEHIDDEGVVTLSMLVTDAFKEVRDSLQFMSPDPTSQIISISSDNLISQKSINSIIFNLSNSITYGGQRVVVLDLNMQNPSIHQKFNLFNDDGVSTVLSHRAMISKVVRYTDNENLDVVTAGTYPPNPWELIDSKRMLEVLEKLRNVYDVIILNMPSLREDRFKALDMADVNMYIINKAMLDNNTKDNIDTLKSGVKRFSILFYDEKE